MKEVKVLPKFKCDFCKRRSVKHIMLKHESSCYLNPNRICWKCNNTGKYSQEFETAYGQDYHTVDCNYCEEYEKITKENKETDYIINNLPHLK